MSNREIKIEVNNLCKTLNDKKVLDNLDLKIFEGETFVLLGQSGSGKSVLLKHLIGLMIPDNGQIYIDGNKIDYNDFKQADSIRRNFGMLFQGGALFDSLSVGENLLFALDHLRTDLSDSEKEKKVLHALELV